MKLEDLMKMSKGDEEKDPKDMMKAKAKMEVIQELRKMASDMMGEGLKDGMQQVTVASDDPEGLKEGLEMAEDVVEEGPEAMMAKESESYEPDMEMMAESDDEEEMEMSPEEIEAKIAELMEKKDKLSRR